MSNPDEYETRWTFQTLAAALFALLEAKRQVARLDAFREVSPDYRVRIAPTPEQRASAEDAYTRACERYEAAVVESVRLYRHPLLRLKGDLPEKNDHPA